MAERFWRSALAPQVNLQGEAPSSVRLQLGEHSICDRQIVVREYRVNRSPGDREIKATGLWGISITCTQYNLIGIFKSIATIFNLIQIICHSRPSPAGHGNAVASRKQLN